MPANAPLETYISQVAVHSQFLERRIDWLLICKFIGTKQGKLTQLFVNNILSELSFSRKLNLAYKLKLIPKKLFIEVGKLNQIRNKVIHDVNFYHKIGELEPLLNRFCKADYELGSIIVTFEPD